MKEDFTQWLDMARTLDLDDQQCIWTRPHFVWLTSTLVAVALTKAMARANSLQRGAPSKPLVKSEMKVMGQENQAQSRNQGCL